LDSKIAANQSSLKKDLYQSFASAIPPMQREGKSDSAAWLPPLKRVGVSIGWHA
jgi:hypothetical protein